MIEKDLRSGDHSRWTIWIRSVVGSSTDSPAGCQTIASSFFTFSSSSLWISSRPHISSLSTWRVIAFAGNKQINPIPATPTAAYQIWEIVKANAALTWCLTGSGSDDIRGMIAYERDAEGMFWNSSSTAWGKLEMRTFCRIVRPTVMPNVLSVWEISYGWYLSQWGWWCLTVQTSESRRAEREPVHCLEPSTERARGSWARCTWFLINPRRPIKSQPEAPRNNSELTKSNTIHDL